MAKRDLSVQELRAFVSYDPLTGLFTRLVKTNRQCIMTPWAGVLTKRGNRSLCVKGSAHAAHRLAWLYMTGQWPTLEIDHINGDPADNKFANLREASSGQNKQNRHKIRSDNKHGLIGVHIHDRSKKTGLPVWRAKIHLNGKAHHIGLYNTPEEAQAAYVEAKRRLHPFGML